MNDLQDRAALVAEITDLAETNIAELDQYRNALSQLRLSDDPGTAPITVFDRADELIAGAERCWRDSVTYVCDEHITDWDAFSQVMPLAGTAIKETAAARALLLRHTPTLRGFPSGTAPEQAILGEPRTNTVDYLRGGMCYSRRPRRRRKPSPWTSQYSARRPIACNVCSTQR